jgi:hypothetical protein
MYPLSDGCAPQRRSGKINSKFLGCAAVGAFVLLCLVGGAGAGGWYWYNLKADEAAKQAERQEILDVFNPELTSYLDIKPKPLLSNKSKFKGKVICIDLDNKQIDADAQIALPNSLKATKPDEVGAVAWLSWSEEVAGDYPDGSMAKIHIVYVTLIEMPTDTIVVYRTPIRGDTQATKSGAGDRLGPMPWDKLSAFLQEHADTN